MLLSSMLVALANETTFLGLENAQPFIIFNVLTTYLAALLTAFEILYVDRGQRR